MNSNGFRQKPPPENYPETEMFTPIWNGKLPIFHPPPFFWGSKNCEFCSRDYGDFMIFMPQSMQLWRLKILSPTPPMINAWNLKMMVWLFMIFPLQLVHPYSQVNLPLIFQGVTSKQLLPRQPKRSQLTWMVVFESLMLARRGWLLRQWIGHPVIPCELQGV